MMTVLPLAKIGKVLDRPHYVEEAKRQFLLHIQYLFDAKTGLFHHGWTFEEGGHNFANAAWGRGNRCESRRRRGLSITDTICICVTAGLR